MRNVCPRHEKPEARVQSKNKGLEREESTLQTFSLRARRGGEFIGEPRRFTAVIGSVT